MINTLIFGYALSDLSSTFDAGAATYCLGRHVAYLRRLAQTWSAVVEANPIMFRHLQRSGRRAKNHAFGTAENVCAKVGTA